MTDRIPIKPEDIRAGDRILMETPGGVLEYTAAEHGEAQEYFLIHRPVVELPEGATLGWASGRDGNGARVKNVLGSWCVGASGDWLNRTSYTWADNRGECHFQTDDVIEFIPAIAVGAEDLEEVRRVFSLWNEGDAHDTDLAVVLSDFFDKALS